MQAAQHARERRDLGKALAPAAHGRLRALHLRRRGLAQLGQLALVALLPALGILALRLRARRRRSVRRANIVNPNLNPISTSLH